LCYFRKLWNLESVEEFYRLSSCATYFDGVKVPMVFINSEDDPIIPPPMLNTIKDAVKKHHNFLYIEQKYGGHLGFYQGGYLMPNPTTWLDNAIVSLADSLASYTSTGKDKAAAAAAAMSEMDSGGEATMFDREFTPSSGNASSSEEEDFVASLLLNKKSGVMAASAKKRRSGAKYVCKRKRLNVASHSRTHFVNLGPASVSATV
jgi:hypothetical protein